MATQADERRIRQLTIEAQLQREFADRMETEADAWLAEATAKRTKAVAHRMQADALTTEAHLIRTARKRASRQKETEAPPDD